MIIALNFVFLPRSSLLFPITLTPSIRISFLLVIHNLYFLYYRSYQFHFYFVFDCFVPYLISFRWQLFFSFIFFILHSYTLQRSFIFVEPDYK